MEGKCLSTLNYDSYIVAILVILDTLDLYLKIKRGKGATALVKSLA